MSVKTVVGDIPPIKESKHGYGPKIKFFKMYGCECACCGETNPLFLTLDHVNNDGGKLRTHGNNESEYRKAVTEYRPDVYQVLCYNCNLGKARNHGICPHKDIRLKEEWGEDLEIKTCIECNNPYRVDSRYSTQSKYCSMQCKDKAKVRVRKENRHLESKLKSELFIPIIRVCPHCDSYFMIEDILSVSKVYCSNRCQSRAKEQRKRKRHSKDSII